MAKRKNEKPQQPSPQGENELQALYAKMRQQFTAADLQKYTEIEPGIPLEDVIAEMEAIHREETEKRKCKIT
jgi:hypothetical protein